MNVSVQSGRCGHYRTRNERIRCVFLDSALFAARDTTHSHDRLEEWRLKNHAQQLHWISPFRLFQRHHRSKVTHEFGRLLLPILRVAFSLTLTPNFFFDGLELPINLLMLLRRLHKGPRGSFRSGDGVPCQRLTPKANPGPNQGASGAFLRDAHHLFRVEMRDIVIGLTIPLRTYS